MSKFKLLSAVAAIAIGAANMATAQAFQKYGDVEGWNVFLDTEKKSCLIEKFDDFGNVVQMGLTADRGVAYVGVFTKNETEIQQGDRGAVAVLLDDNLYIGEVGGLRGSITKGYAGGYILTDDPQFVEDIARKYTMTVFPQKEYAFVVDLTGTYKAIEMARKCNSEM